MSQTDAALGNAVHSSLHDLFRAMARTLPGGELHETDRYAMHHAAPLSPIFKAVWGVNAPAEDLPGVIADAEGWLRDRSAPFAFWWGSPGTDPVETGTVLEAHGWSAFELDAPCQVAGMAELDWAARERVPDCFAVERITDADGAVTFGATFAESNGVPPWAGGAWADATVAAGLEAAPWTLYVGRLDGRPVASTILFRAGDGVATVLGVGTVENARRQGIGAAITLAALADARHAGDRAAVLFATDLGAPVYRRLGFRDVPGWAVSRWLWRADA